MPPVAITSLEASIERAAPFMPAEATIAPPAAATPAGPAAAPTAEPPAADPWSGAPTTQPFPPPPDGSAGALLPPPPASRAIELAELAVQTVVFAARTGERDIPCATSAASVHGISFSTRNGANAAITRMAVPTNKVPMLAAAWPPIPVSFAPALPAPARAATPTEIAMHTTSFERITDSNSSIVRRRTPRADGHTIAAKDSGDSATRM